MTDDLEIARLRKRGKARVIKTDDGLFCECCGTKLHTEDRCPECGMEIDWGF